MTPTCRCGHRRAVHVAQQFKNAKIVGATVPVDGKPTITEMGPACSTPLCTCDGFVADRTLSFVRVARLAALVLRHDLYADVTVEHGKTVTVKVCDVAPEQVEHVAAPSGSGPDEMAEALSLYLAERARELAHAPLLARPNEPRRRFGCRTCGAAEGQDCRPVHDGEREAGAWVHPERGQPAAHSLTPADIRALRDVATSARDYARDGGFVSSLSFRALGLLTSLLEAGKLDYRKGPHTAMLERAVATVDLEVYRVHGGEAFDNRRDARVSLSSFAAAVRAELAKQVNDRDVAHVSAHAAAEAGVVVEWRLDGMIYACRARTRIAPTP